MVICHGFFVSLCFFFFQAEDGIRDAQESRGLGDVYKRQTLVETASTPDETAVETTGDRHIKNTVFRLVVKGLSLIHI